MRTEHISIAYDESGKCKSISKCVVVDKLTLNKLKNEENEHIAKQDLEKQKLLKRICELEICCEKLLHLVKHLFGEEELDEQQIKGLLGVEDYEEQKD